METAMDRQNNVLFLCTGNSARSILAEAILNHKNRPKFTAFSAGSHPSGHVRPEALRQLASALVPTDGLRSKSWPPARYGVTTGRARDGRTMCQFMPHSSAQITGRCFQANGCPPAT